MKHNQRTPELCGNIILANGDRLADTAYAVGMTAAMLKEVLAEQSLEDACEWPPHWNPARVDAVLTLIEASAAKLGETLVFATEDGDQ